MVLLSLDKRTLSQSAKGTKISNKTYTNEDIVEMYQEIINLRQRGLAEQLRLLEYGRGGFSGFTIAKVKLSEARIQLSQFQGKHDIVVMACRS